MAADEGNARILHRALWRAQWAVVTVLATALPASALLTLVPALLAAQSASAGSILFIGNSFTYAHGSPVRYYRTESVTDLNGDGQGGVPALFKSFTRVTTARRPPRQVSSLFPSVECSGFELGLSTPQVGALEQVAFDQLASEGTLSAAPAKPAVKAASPAKCSAAR